MPYGVRKETYRRRVLFSPIAFSLGRDMITLELTLELTPRLSPFPFREMDPYRCWLVLYVLVLQVLVLC
jgi:hypothetical protein